MATRDDTFTIVQISDLHCGTQFFLPNLLERAITEVNDLQPDVVVCSGDLTTFGFKEEYALAKDYLDQLECEAVVVIPGNHDSRNVGYVHFEQLFGDRNSVTRVGGVTVVAVDSTEPDLDHGQIGRGRYSWIEESFAAPADLRIFVCHHHLLPGPGTRRERNIIYDAGDAIAGLPYEVIGAWLAGGTEKLRGPADYGVPLLAALEDGFGDAEVVVDLSDEPVLGPRERMLLASRVLAAGLRYEGADFHFEAPELASFPLPSLAVIGTGKRVGKTAVTAHVARLLARDRDVVVVAMGRGGPPKPQVAIVRPTLESLLELSRAGQHA